MNLSQLLSLPLLPVALAGVLVGATPALADELPQTPSVIVYVQGTVKVTRGAETVVAALGTEVRESDTVATEENSQVRIRLYDRSLLRLGANSQMQMAQMRADATAEKKTISVKLVVGRLWASVSKLLTSDSAFEVQTQSAVAGVRGTHISASSDKDGNSEFGVGEGRLEVKTSDGQKRMVERGKEAVVSLKGFQLMRDLGVAQTALLLDNARGNPATGGAADKASDQGGRDINNKIEKALDKARERMANDNKNANNGNNSNDRQNHGRDRQSEKKLGTQDAVEQRQRANDTFNKFNERAAATRLRAIIEVRE